jgi:NNP family nitrate/nitrite transporter-like MFS transporter
MQLKGFLKAGHTPSLMCAFGYFDVSFMVWVLLGPLAAFIATDYGLDLTRDAFWVTLLSAVPLLGGSVLRVVLGLMTDRIGPRRTGLFGLAVTLVPLSIGWLVADSYGWFVVVGLLLGVAGASFAAALPLASRWYPPQYQGLVMGIAGAGNSGTALATLFAPVLAKSLGWHAVFGLALIPVAVMLLLFALFAKDSPDQPPPRPWPAYAQVLAQRDTWWFCGFYAVTFGGFVGLASFLNTFFVTQYADELAGLAGRFGAAEPKVVAGYFATACVIAGSFLRPVGGYLADRFGGIRMLGVLYVGAGLTMLAVAALGPLALTAAALFAGLGCLGMGNGSVFQLVPQRFAREIGVVTGVVGAAGGLGGFLLQNLLGSLKQWTGTYAGGFLAFAGVGFACAAALVVVSRRWEREFVAAGGVVGRGPEPEPVGVVLAPSPEAAS